MFLVLLCLGNFLMLLFRFEFLRAFGMLLRLVAAAGVGPVATSEVVTTLDAAIINNSDENMPSSFPFRNDDPSY